MIRCGEVDVAAIDRVTYARLERYRPTDLVGIRKLGRTNRVPAVPYVTRWADDDTRFERLRAAVFNAFADPRLATSREALFLKDIEALPVSAYQRISEFEDHAAHQGYPELRSQPVSTRRRWCSAAWGLRLVYSGRFRSALEPSRFSQERNFDQHCGARGRAATSARKQPRRQTIDTRIVCRITPG